MNRNINIVKDDEVVEMNKYVLELLEDTCPGMDPVSMAVTANELLKKAKIMMKEREELKKKRKLGHQKRTVRHSDSKNQVQNGTHFLNNTVIRRTKLEVIEEE